MNNRDVPVILDPMCAHSTWHRKIVAGVRKAAALAQRNVHLFEKAEDFDPASPSRSVILTGFSHEGLLHTVKTLTLCHKRIILVGMDSDSLASQVSCVTHSRSQQTIQLIQYLYACDRKRIALAGVGRNSLNDLVKLDGAIRYTRTLEHPIEHKDVYDWSDMLEESISAFMARRADYDAVICSNDYAALLLINRLKAEGVDLPRELYVAGFSNQSISRFCSPSITTITMDFTEIGRYAYSIWQQYQSASDDDPVYKIIAPGRLVIRESTGCQRPEMPDGEKAITLLGDRDKDMFYNEPNIQKLMMIGNCLDNHDALDHQIIQRVLRGISYEAIMDELYVSSGSLHYRLAKLYRELNCKTRVQFMAFFKRYYGDFQVNETAEES